MQEVMHICIEQGEKAFRINGVTFAKRHLVNTLAKNTNGDLEKMLAKFLVIVPFLATSYTASEHASESIKYGAIKAKRLYKALGITDENTIPFMLVCLQQAGESIAEMGKSVREAGFYEQGTSNIPFQKGTNEPETCSPSSHPSKKGPTLH